MVRKTQQKKGFILSFGYLFLFIIIFAIMLAVAFGLGVNIGKKRLIQEEMEAMRQSETKPPIMTKTIAESQTQPETPVVNQSEPASTVVAVSNQQPEPEKPKPEYTITPQYTIQVGVFSSLENAAKLSGTLNSYEYDSWVLSKTNGGKTLHFVFNGRFGTKEEAERAGRLMKERITFIQEYKVKEIER